MFRSIVLLVVAIVSLWSVPLPAQEAVLGQEYGAGVHAFFADDYVKAYEQLSAAITGGSQDPRAFYFRGLACLKLGRPQDAAIDFRKGSSLESADINRFYDVGRALERVQGSERGQLETYRVAARMAALEQAERMRKARYEAIQREESRVLRQQAQAAPPVDIEPPPAAQSESAEEADPFATSKDAPAAAPEKKPVEPKKLAPPEKKPAAKPALPRVEEDPFAAEPSAPAKKSAAATKAAKPAAGAKPSTSKKLPAKPAPKTPPKPDLNDPFAS
jgi:hypothetical protein